MIDPIRNVKPMIRISDLVNVRSYRRLYCQLRYTVIIRRHDEHLHKKSSRFIVCGKYRRNFGYPFISVNVSKAHGVAKPFALFESLDKLSGTAKTFVEQFSVAVGQFFRQYRTPEKIFPFDRFFDSRIVCVNGKERHKLSVHSLHSYKYLARLFVLAQSEVRHSFDIVDP